MPVTADHTPLSVRVPTSLAEALRRRAVTAERTLAAEVRLALRRHVEGEGRPPNPAAEGGAPPSQNPDRLEDPWTHATA